MSDKIELMARLWNVSELSMSEIGNRVGLNRQQVAGLIHRNRDKFMRRNERQRTDLDRKPAEPIATASQKANQRRQAFHAVKVAEEAKAAPVTPVEPEIDGKEYDAARLPMAKDLLGLDPCHCRWPLTDIGPHLFCCAEVVTGSVYCRHHKARSKGRGSISEQKAATEAKRIAA